MGLAGVTTLLIRLPYRPPVQNAIYTGVLLLSAYAYLRFRCGLIPPLVVVFCLALSVATDVFGNAFELYGTRVGPIEFDDLAHVVTAGLTLPAVMWLLDEVTRLRRQTVSVPLLAALSTTATFSLSAYYEIVELWDELFLGGERLWGARDTPADLQWNLLGIVLAALVSAPVFVRARARRKPATRPSASESPDRG